MTRLVTFLTVVSTAFVLTSCGDTGTTTDRPTTAAKPALWKVADSDTTIYLFGTFHVLPAGLDWRTPALEKAVGDADSLLLELADVDQSDIAAPFAKLATSPGLPPVADRVPKDKQAALTALLEKTGQPAATFDGLETWAVGFALAGVVIEEAGFGAANGVDDGLEKEFDAAGKPVAGLETVEQQLGIFDQLPEASQRRFLVSALDDPAEIQRELATLLDVWSTGDEAAIGVSFDKELREDPALKRALLTQRNEMWAREIIARLDAPGTVLVAVGAGHLAGEGSVQTILQREGLSVTRL